jgi:sulfoacetaldehyde acetyltransferase
MCFGETGSGWHHNETSKQEPLVTFRLAEVCRTGAGRTLACQREDICPMKMTTEEAFVKVLQMHGIEHAFGIIGSAMMPISDLFPQAGIKFWDCAHECNAGMMADGFTRASGKMSMMVAQNGPGITNFVTPVKTAYWNHTPLLLVTPQAANKTIGQGGFQEIEQMKLFEDMVCYQEEVRDPSRMAEVLNRVIEKAWRGCAPAQINVPRDYWTQVIDIELPQIVRLERPRGGEAAIEQAAKMLSDAKFPVILNGAGVVIGGAIGASRELAERLSRHRSAAGYQHNDAFPGSHPLGVGPLGYNGSKAAYGADLQGGRGAGAGHPAQPVLDPCRATASTTGRRTPRSSRSTSTQIALG